MDRPAIVLLSGGLDSTTVLAMAIAQGYIPYTLSFNYGQRHNRELEFAQQIASSAQVARHVVANIDLRTFGASALTDHIDVPKHDTVGELDDNLVPVTYVPARNTIFLSYALAYAETSGATDIFLGVNALDYSGYPDCRPEYIEAFQAMANLATRTGIEGSRTTIHTPLIAMTKSEIIRVGLDLSVDYSATWSCYDPGLEGLACAQCDSCLLRLKGFGEAGAVDPLAYRNLQ